MSDEDVWMRLRTLRTTYSSEKKRFRLLKLYRILIIVNQYSPENSYVCVFQNVWLYQGYTNKLFCFLFHLAKGCCLEAILK